MAGKITLVTFFLFVFVLPNVQIRVGVFGFRVIPANYFENQNAVKGEKYSADTNDEKQDYIWGERSYRDFLADVIVAKQKGKLFRKVSEKISYPSTSKSTMITCIRAFNQWDTAHGAKVSLLHGGPHYKVANISVDSKPSQGYWYKIEIFAK